jgi:NADH-quinone oxidoreductase subunit N
MSALIPIAAAGHIQGPHIDYAGLSPFIVLTVGGLVVLLFGLLRSQVVREQVVPALTLLTLAGAIGTMIWRFNDPTTLVAGALRLDDLALIIDMICAVAAISTVVLSWRSVAPRTAGHGEYHALLLFSVLGMALLSSSQDLVTLFVGIELLSIPLYILCASEHRREGSLESGLKYLIIGSVGSATLVYGLAMIYGATGSTSFTGIAAALSGGLANGALGDPLFLTGVGLVTVGFAFKASVAPFHQWTPDVYEGAPTPITAFMATATKAAALAIFLRFFDSALPSEQSTWAPLLAALAAVTMIVGNVGALTQTSLKRMLGYSGVAQAGYLLTGVVVGTQLGATSTVLYLMIYLLMNIAAFAVVHHQELDTGDDQVGGLAGLPSRSPELAWSLTIAMLALAGIPGTAGFVGKFQLIDALVDGNYTWLAIVLVIGAVISLGYYLRVVAAIWMSPAETARRPISATTLPEGLAPIAGGSPEADALGGGSAGADQTAGESPGDEESPAKRPVYTEVVAVALLFAAACIVFGIVPSPLFNLASHAGAALTGVF